MSALKPSYGNGFFEVGPEFGFLPKSAPLRRLPAQYAELQALMDDLPVWKNLDSGEHGLLANEGAIVDRVAAMPDILDKVEAEQDVFVQAALYRALTFAASAYLLEPSHHEQARSGNYGKGRKVLPANISRPLVNVSPKLGVFPYLDYHYAYSLGNYVKKDPSGSFEYTNLDMACKFAGTRDEIGFIMLHVDIDSHSPALLESIWDFARAPSLAALQRNLDTMYRINDRRKLMWEASEWKNYNDFRVFIMGIQGNNTIFDDGVVYAGCFDNQLQQFRGQSGSQDDIIPTEDIFTGLINYYPQNELTSYLMDMRRYRPAVVQEFFTDLEACRFSLATFESLGVDALVLLNAIVDQIFIFRNGHWMFVQKYIMANTAHPIATGGTPITTWIPNQIQACLTYQSVIQARISDLGGAVGSEYTKLYHSLRETLGKKQELLAKQQQELVKPDFDAKVVFKANPKFLREDHGLAGPGMSPTGSPAAGSPGANAAGSPGANAAQQCPFKF